MKKTTIATDVTAWRGYSITKAPFVSESVAREITCLPHVSDFAGNLAFIPVSRKRYATRRHTCDYAEVSWLIFHQNKQKLFFAPGIKYKRAISFALPHTRGLSTISGN